MEVGILSWEPWGEWLSALLKVQKRRKQATSYRQKELGYNPKDLRLLLTTEDLSEALREVRGAICYAFSGCRV